MSGNYLCNLVIPGAAKSGTSSLHELLDGHPDIRMSTGKEPHYFCRDDVYRRGPGFHNGLFDPHGAERYFGESSTGYLIWPGAIERIRRDLVDPKIIIILRPPVERAFSHYRWRVRLGFERRSFLEAMKQDGYGFDPHRPDQFGYKCYLQFSKYSGYCPLWIDAFGAANCHFINTASLQAETGRTLERVHAFLGLKHVSPECSVEANRTADVVLRRSPLASMGSFVPVSLKRTSAYQALRKHMLAKMTPEPPREMTRAEAAYATEALAEDIRYFDALFG